MKLNKVMGIFMKYFALVGMLGIYVFSLYRNIAACPDEAQQPVYLWRDALLISATLGLLGAMFALDKVSRLTTGNAQNMWDDIVRQDSKDVSVMFNGMIVAPLFMGVIILLTIAYLKTNHQLFAICATILGIIVTIFTVAKLLALYLRAREEKSFVRFSGFFDSIFLSPTICLLLLMITSRKTVGVIYWTLQEPENSVVLILSLIAVLVYVFAAVFCHFSNVYCIIAAAYTRKDPNRVQLKLDSLREKEEKRENSLRQAAEHLDKTVPQACICDKIALTCRFFRIHVVTYCQDWIYSLLYVLSFARLKVVQRLNKLLEKESVRINRLRFCEIAIVLELLVLDMLLFIYLGSNDPCSRFFDLLSTVIIIPILLSSLASLKRKDS